MSGNHLHILFKHFRFFSPFCFVIPAIVFSGPAQSQDSRSSSGREKIIFSGVVSTSLDSLTKSNLTFSIIDEMLMNEDFSVLDRTSLSDTIEIMTRQSRPVSADLFQGANSPDERRDMLYVVFERYKENFHCSIMMSAPGKKSAEVLDSLVFVSDIQKRIRKAAFHIYRAVCRSYGVAVSEPGRTPLFKLATPMINAALVRDDVLLQQDSVSVVFTDASLVTNEKASMRLIKGAGCKFLLYPSSSYTFLSPNSITVNQGSLGVITLSAGITVLLPTSTCRMTGVIAKFSVKDMETEIRVLTGEVEALPSWDNGEPWIIKNKVYSGTRGYAFTSQEMTEADVLEHFKAFVSHVDAEAVKRFKTSKSQILEEPVYDVDFLRSGSPDPIDDYIAAGLAEIGIPAEALEFWGEAWPINERSIKTGIHETGCYLCTPDHTGALSH